MRVFDRSEKRVVGDLKNAWETGGFETEQGPMVFAALLQILQSDVQNFRICWHHPG